MISCTFATYVAHLRREDRRPHEAHSVADTSSSCDSYRLSRLDVDTITTEICPESGYLSVKLMLMLHDEGQGVVVSGRFSPEIPHVNFVNSSIRHVRRSKTNPGKGRLKLSYLLTRSRYCRSCCSRRVLIGGTRCTHNLSEKKQWQTPHDSLGCSSETLGNARGRFSSLRLERSINRDQLHSAGFTIDGDTTTVIPVQCKRPGMYA